MLSFHRVRELVASGMVGFYFSSGDSNPVDILSLSKHWRYSNICNRVKPLRFWKGDTIDIEDQSTPTRMKESDKISVLCIPF